MKGSAVVRSEFGHVGDGLQVAGGLSDFLVHLVRVLSVTLFYTILLASPVPITTDYMRHHRGPRDAVQPTNNHDSPY
jgi:hypothetical protein